MVLNLPQQNPFLLLALLVINNRKIRLLARRQVPLLLLRQLPLLLPVPVQTTIMLRRPQTMLLARRSLPKPKKLLLLLLL
jgi:hypothetical protein